MAEEIKAGQITWDGTNPCLMVLFVEKHGGALDFHYETGVTLLIHGLKLPVPMGASMVATESGITVVVV
jgi:hypothetical protein